MLQFDERIVIIGGLGKIVLIDFIKLTVEEVIEDIRIKDQYILTFLRLSDDLILYGCGKEYENKYGQLGIINMKTRKIQEIKSDIDHICIMNMLYINKNTIAIGGDTSINIIQI